MKKPETGSPDFAAAPSAPKAGRLVRVVVILVLLAVAVGAIWWIDKGAWGK